MKDLTDYSRIFIKLCKLLNPHVESLPSMTDFSCYNLICVQARINIEVEAGVCYSKGGPVIVEHIMVGRRMQRVVGTVQIMSAK